jgi:hypothetical protein
MGRWGVADTLSLLLKLILALSQGEDVPLSRNDHC